MLGLLYDLQQNARIADAEAAAGQSKNKTERVAQNLQDLEERIDKLSLLNYALWTLLEEKVGLTEAELLARVQELDLKDGKLDGRVSGGVVNCPHCDRPLSQRRRKCLYCGYELHGEGGFESVVR